MAPAYHPLPTKDRRGVPKGVYTGGSGQLRPDPNRADERPMGGAL